MDGSTPQVRVMVGEEELEVPEALVGDKELFRAVLNADFWKHLLNEEDRERLRALLPSNSASDFEDIIGFATSSQELRFGVNTVDSLWEKLASGLLEPSVWMAGEQRKQLLLRQYKLSQADYFVQLLQELLVSRQTLLQQALFAGSLENMWKAEGPGGSGQRGRGKEHEEDQEYETVLRDVEYAETGERGGGVKGAGEDRERETSSIFSEEEYRSLLRGHRKHRQRHVVSYLSQLDQLTEEAGEGVLSRGMLEIPPTKRSRFAGDEEGELLAPSTSFPSRKHARAEQEVGVARKEGGRRGRRTVRERSQHEGTTLAQARAIYDIYTPLDNGQDTDDPIKPIILEGPLPEGKFKSFFSVLKAVFDSTNDRKGELGKLSKALSQLIRSSECGDCSWLSERSDWLELTLSALCYLSAEVGAVSSFNSLPHFVPLVEFRDRVDNWKWIGSGRDCEMELLVLCNHWIQNLDQSLPVVDYSDYEPPPPHVWTSRNFQQSTPEELAMFRQMERERYSSPHKSYLYNIRGYESPVGPVKGAKVTKRDGSSKARGHALLVPDRPNCVTILSLVRDATSRLPNGEGTRLDLCIQVQDSQYIADFVSETQLNNAVSGALDRLHYEKDPCVRYDGTRKVWIYLHRARNNEDFERIHWACEVAAKQRKLLFARLKIKPRIILRTDGKDEVLEEGSSPSSLEEGGEAGKVGKRSSGPRAGAQQQSAELSVGMPTTPHLPQPGQLSLVVATIVQGRTAAGCSQEGGGAGNMLGLTLQPALQALEDQKPMRKRKQSLKIAELLQEEAMSKSSTPGDATPPSHTADDAKTDNATPPSPSSSCSSSSSGSWSSDEDQEAVVISKGRASSKVKGEGTWPHLPDDTSPNSSD